LLYTVAKSDGMSLTTSFAEQVSSLMKFSWTPKRIRRLSLMFCTLHKRTKFLVQPINELL
jgi:hypothetical protein